MRLARKPPLDFGLQRSCRKPVDEAALNEIIWCASGRGALELALQALGLQAGQAVLLPDYVCDVVAHPLQRLGLRAVWYALHDDFAPDWADLERKMPQAQAALLVHFFGQPQDALRFGQLCRSAGVIFLEDNAHGYGALFQGRLLGTWGDAGFVSPWKQYEVAHGAGLWLNSAPAHDRARSVLASWPVAGLPGFTAWCKSRVRDVLSVCSPLRRLVLPAPSPEQIAPEEAHGPEAAHPCVTQRLKSLQPQKDARHRRSIYQQWALLLAQTSLTPAFAELADGAAPLCFAAYAQDVAQRNRWLTWGWKHDIAVHTWPTLPEELRSQPQAIDRWQRLLCFPIHHAMDMQCMHCSLEAISLPS